MGGDDTRAGQWCPSSTSAGIGAHGPAISVTRGATGGLGVFSHERLLSLLEYNAALDDMTVVKYVTY